MNTDKLLKEAMESNFKRTSDLFDIFRLGFTDRKGLESGCQEIIADANFKKEHNMEVN